MGASFQVHQNLACGATPQQRADPSLSGICQKVRLEACESSSAPQGELLAVYAKVMSAM